MKRDHTGDLQVAIATGQGAGRFLAAALLDTLSGGGLLVEVAQAPSPPHRSAHGFDFVFGSLDDTTSEVIRAGTNQRSELVCAQLLRRPMPAFGQELPQGSELARALRAAKSVGQLRWRTHTDGSSFLDVVLLPQRLTIRIPGPASLRAGPAPEDNGPPLPDENGSARPVGLDE